jgi:hypothetical protein
MDPKHIAKQCQVFSTIKNIMKRWTELVQWKHILTVVMSNPQPLINKSVFLLRKIDEKDTIVYKWINELGNSFSVPVKHKLINGQVIVSNFGTLMIYMDVKDNKFHGKGYVIRDGERLIYEAQFIDNKLLYDLCDVTNYSHIYRVICTFVNYDKDLIEQHVSEKNMEEFKNGEEIIVKFVHTDINFSEKQDEYNKKRNCMNNILEMSDEIMKRIIRFEVNGHFIT